MVFSLICIHLRYIARRMKLLFMVDTESYVPVIVMCRNIYRLSKLLATWTPKVCMFFADIMQNRS